MSNIDLGTLEYDFLLNLTGFEEGARRVGVQLNDLDRKVEQKLNQIGNRNLQLQNRVKVVYAEIDRTVRAAGLTWIKSLDTLSGATLRLERLQEELAGAQSRVNAALQKSSDYYLANGKASRSLAADVGRHRAQVERLNDSITHQARVVQTANESMTHAEASYTELSLKNTARRNKAESDAAVSRARLAYEEQRALEQQLAADAKLHAEYDARIAREHRDEMARLKAEEAERARVTKAAQVQAAKMADLQLQASIEAVRAERAERAAQEKLAESYVAARDVAAKELKAHIGDVLAAEEAEILSVKRLEDARYASLERQLAAHTTATEKMVAEDIAAGRKRMAAWNTVANRMAIVGALIAAPFVLSAKAAADWQKTLTQVGVMTDQTGAALERTGQRIRQVARTINVLPVEAAQQFLKLRELGRTTEQAFQQLTVIGQAARGTAADVKSVMDAVVAGMNAYHAGVERTSQVTDILLRVQKNSNMSWDQLKTAIGQSGAQLASYGLSLQDVGASFIALRRGSIEAASVGTALAQVMARLAHPATSAAKLAKELGLSWLASGDALNHIAKVGWPTALREIEKATGGSSSRILALFGGASHAGGSRGMIALLANDMAEFKKAAVDVFHTAGASAAASAKVQGTYTDAVRALKNAWNDLQISLGTTVLPMLTRLTRSLTAAVEWFNRLAPANQTRVVQLGLITGAFLLITSAVIKTVLAVVKLRDALIALSIATWPAKIMSAWGWVAGVATGGGILGAIAAATVAAVAFGAAIWVGGYIGRLLGIQDAWEGINKAQERALRPRDTVPAYRKAIDYIHARNMGQGVAPPDAETMAVIQHQLQRRHLTSLDQLSIGQWRGVEADLRTGEANLLRPTTRRPRAGRPAGGEQPILAPHLGFGGAPVAGGTAPKTIAEKIAAAAEAMLGQPGGTGTSQELVNRALRAGGISEKSTNAFTAFAELARVGQRAATPRRGDIGLSPRGGAFVVRGVNPDGSINVVYDPGGRGAHDVHTGNVPAALVPQTRFLRFGPMSAPEQSAQIAAQRAREAQARRQLAEDRRVEREAGLAGFQGELHRAYAMPEGPERIRAVAQIMEKRNDFLAHLARQHAQDNGTATRKNLDLITLTFDRLNAQEAETVKAKINAYQQKVIERSSTLALSTRLKALQSERRGMGTAAKDLTPEKIDRLRDMALEEANINYEAGMRQLPAGERGNALNPQVQALDAALDAARKAAEEERSRRLDELANLTAKNDERQQALLSKEINRAIRRNEEELRFQRGLTPAERERKQATFIRGKIATGGLIDTADLEARAGELESQAGETERKRSVDTALADARNARRTVVGEKDRSAATLATAAALQQVLDDPVRQADPARRLDAIEVEDVTAEIARLKAQAEAESADYQKNRTDYISGRQLEDLQLGAKGAQSGVGRRFSIFGGRDKKAAADRVTAIGLLSEAQKKRVSDEQFGYSDPAYFEEIRKQVNRLMKPRSVWQDMVDDAQKKFGNIIDSFSDAIGEMAAKGGSLKSWWRNLWGDMVSWFTSYVVRNILTGITQMLSPRQGGAAGQGGGGLLGGLFNGVFGGGGGAPGGGGGLLGGLFSPGPGGTAPIAAPLGALPTSAGGGANLLSLLGFAGGAGEGGAGLGLGAAEAATGTIGPTMANAAMMGFATKGAAAGVARRGVLGTIGGQLAAAMPYVVAAQFLAQIFGKKSFLGKLFSFNLGGLFGHHHHRGGGKIATFDDPVNDFSAAKSGRDFTQLFLQGVTQRMAYQTAEVMSPRMGLIWGHSRLGRQLMEGMGQNQGQPAVRPFGGGTTVNFNNPTLLDRTMVDKITDHVDRNLASKLQIRAGRGTQGGRDRI